MRILAGDIGGTNTRLILADIHENDQHILIKKSYPSAQYPDFIQVLENFLTDTDASLSIDAACFAVAGPVYSGIVQVTNLPWVITEQQVRSVINTQRVALINDFVAVGYGIPLLSASDLLLLQQPDSNLNDSQFTDAAVIGAGTGLGVSHLVYNEGSYRPYSSEAGHVGFAPENQQQLELLAWLQKNNSHVSIEMLLSGDGLERIYKFLHESTGLSESLSVAQAMRHSDPAQVITNHALQEEDDLCVKTLDLFVDIYGSAAGNVALHYHPIGSLYIAGGIAAKISQCMNNGRFIKAFRSKGKMSSNLSNISVQLITQEKVGLYGAISYASSIGE